MMVYLKYLSYVFFASITLLVLSSCANVQVDQALAAQQVLIGMPKSTLLSCAGVPQRMTSINNRDFFTYEAQRTDVDLNSHISVFGAQRHFGYGMGFPYDWDRDVSTQSCTATFTLHNGTVEQLVYGGNSRTDGPALDLCYHIVQNCLPPGP